MAISSIRSRTQNRAQPTLRERLEMTDEFDIKREARAQAQSEAANAMLAQDLSGAPGPYASGFFPEQGLDPKASQPVQQRTLENFMNAGGSAESAATLAQNVQSGRQAQQDQMAKAKALADQQKATRDSRAQITARNNIYRDDIRKDMAETRVLSV
ncbi:unnamed protein product, partial [marine sediment metagenome]